LKREHYIILASVPFLAIGLFMTGEIIQDYFLYRQSVCIAQVYGVYRIQVFATPAAPSPGEEVELTAVVRTVEDKIPHEGVKVVLTISKEKNIIPLYTSEPQVSQNGIFTFYYTFEESGDYVIGFLIVGKSGVVNVNAPLTVGEPIPFENYVIPAVFLAIPIIMILPLAHVLKARKQE